MGITKSQWEKAVTEAAGLVGGYSKTRWRIVELANYCCADSFGQKSSFNSYPNFAKAIGLDYKTLIDWVRLERNVVSKLTVKQREKIHKVPIELLKRVAENVDESTAPKNVRKTFLTESGANIDNVKFRKYVKVLNTLLYNFTRPMRLKDLEDDVLKEIHAKSKLLSTLSKKELRFREIHGKPSGQDKHLKVSKLIKEL